MTFSIAAPPPTSRISKQAFGRGAYRHRNEGRICCGESLAKQERSIVEARPFGILQVLPCATRAGWRAHLSGKHGEKLKVEDDWATLLGVHR